MPAALLSCADEPALGELVDDRGFSVYMREAIDAGRDCRVIVKCSAIWSKKGDWQACLAESGRPPRPNK